MWLTSSSGGAGCSPGHEAWGLEACTSTEGISILAREWVGDQEASHCCPWRWGRRGGGRPQLTAQPPSTSETCLGGSWKSRSPAPCRMGPAKPPGWGWEAPPEPDFGRRVLQMMLGWVGGDSRRRDQLKAPRGPVFGKGQKSDKTWKWESELHFLSFWVELPPVCGSQPGQPAPLRGTRECLGKTGRVIAAGRCPSLSLL